MIRHEDLDALFVEIHWALGEVAVIDFVGTDEVNINYPPGGELTPEEVAALASLVLSPAARSGLSKVIADRATYPLFHFFALMDGVCDPRGYPALWLGVDFAYRNEDDKDEDRSPMMLHDGLYESYWKYRQAKDGA